MNESLADQSSPATASQSGSLGTLFVLSVLSLFLELAVIRWIGTEFRIFAYLQNIILVVCFLGLGVGCWTCRQPVVPRQFLLPLFALTAIMVPASLFAVGSQISLMLNAFGDILLFTSTVSASPVQSIAYVALGLLASLGLLLLVWNIFLPLGRLLGRLLADDPRTIRAYSVNVAGSLLGVWLFVLVSSLRQPPVTWIAVAAALTLLLGVLIRSLTRWEVALAVGAVVLSAFGGWERGALEVTWSPYQKLALLPGSTKGVRPDEYVISVNNSGGFQTMVDLRPEVMAADPQRFPPWMHGLSQYELPIVLHPAPKKLLILGCGSGDGVAAAVRHRVPEVVGVDIDPAIIDFGRRFHPERPYDSPTVRVVCDDARAFLASSGERFDVISFEELDAHTMTAMTNARLDHYVYTRESFERARSLLAPGGILVLRFAYERPFIADRLFHTLREVFQQEPLDIGVVSEVYGVGGVAFVAGDVAAARRQIDRNPVLTAVEKEWRKTNPEPPAGTTRVATDDWPYLYLETPHIPPLYLLMGVLLLALFASALRGSGAAAPLRGWGRSQWHFFFLGAAFMLLEVQNVSKASVVFGNTWWVNAVIISAVLALVLLANVLGAAFPRLPLAPVYLLLCGSCLGLYQFVDLARFADLPLAAKVAAVGLVACLPMLFSGIVFIRSFASAQRKDAALGANLLGALVGGLLQSVTFITGIQALLLVVAALYLGAFLTRPNGTPVPAESLEPEFGVAGR